ncbi:MAG TPA: hypothetical protein VGK28_03785 [Candidatus Dormibacteraeota bacterium]|jgi:hypothetical protein
MVKRLFSRLQHWAGVETFRTRARQFMAWPAYDLDLRAAASGRTGMGGSLAIVPRQAPATCEMRFMKLHTEGRFEEMWEMLAEDAQRAWGSLQTFVHEMPRLDEWLEILDMQVADVSLLDSWTDPLHQRTYSNVARLLMRYRVRQQWKEWSFDRQVHLVPHADGWRTLCYPTRPRIAASR